MEMATVFISNDGMIFKTEEECKAHERLLFEAEVLKARSELIVRFFKGGDPSLISEFPQALTRLLEELDEEDKIDTWNQFLLHLFLDRDADLFYEGRGHHAVLNKILEFRGPGTSSRDPVEYFKHKAELTFEVVSYLLGKNDACP
jgi:hypothetical protein